ncbi:MAG: hypothetical protein TEF_17240 [Rhizobiales bacterium NRL2]|jgi:predicted dehydrogenase|nr:MAG: hypothetical protein TEF_17240 [Rhizobiales bacterium NRL2]
MTDQKQQIGGRALVVGAGSIGQRHSAILARLGFDVTQVSRHASDAHRSVAAALADGSADYAVIAGETARHLEDLQALAEAGHTGPVLVEKPLSSPGQSLENLPELDIRIAYQLRFHPALRWLKTELAGATAITVQAYVGQYLPTWRPGRDYRETESARRNAGGGALNDLSHELDLLDWLFGGWTSVAALGGRSSRLEIDTDDHFALLCRFERCGAATVELNYLDRAGRRRMIVNTADETFEVDLVAGFVRRNDEPVVALVADRDDPIRDLHRAVLDGGAEATDRASARRTMGLIEAALRSAGGNGAVLVP